VTFPVDGQKRQPEATKELARDMIDVHGAEAADVARANARAAACSGRPDEARTWIRVIDLIQRRMREDAAGTVASVDPAV
jgi:hypothetical protein